MCLIWQDLYKVFKTKPLQFHMPNTIPASRRAQPQKDMQRNKPKVHAWHEDLQPSSENELWVLPLGALATTTATAASTSKNNRFN